MNYDLYNANIFHVFCQADGRAFVIVGFLPTGSKILCNRGQNEPRKELKHK